MRFHNLQGSLPQTAGLAEFVPFFLRRARNRRPPPAIPPDHVLPRAEAIAGLAAAGPDSLTWLGHASFLIRTCSQSL